MEGRETIHAASKSTERYDHCPKCQSGDVRGPIDSPVHPKKLTFKRAWWCPVCWWKHEVELAADAAGI